MRKLYFDIDGTILLRDSGLPKPALTGGRLEAAIRRARVDELICVGNFAGVIRAVWTLRPEYDGLGAIFTLCGGAFVDETWFREVTRLVTDPRLRAAEVDLDADWWYVDDEAARYFTEADRAGLLQQEVGGRILRPSPMGEGDDVLAWIERLARGAGGDGDA